MCILISKLEIFSERPVLIMLKHFKLLQAAQNFTVIKNILYGPIEGKFTNRFRLSE